jgi:hypothetical protein
MYPVKPSLGLSYMTYLLDCWALAGQNIHKIAFFKGAHSEKINSQDDSVALADFSKN